MIEYEKTLFGPTQLLRVYGSAIPRALPGALFSTLFALVLETIDDTQEHLYDSFNHPYPFSVFAWIVGFLVVFRTNLSYQRYWEARSALQAASSKWQDAGCMAAAFNMQSNPGPQPDPTDSTAFLSGLVHYLSLLHAVAILTLRDDDRFENLTVYQPGVTRAPPVDAKDLPEDTRKLFQWSWHFGRKGSDNRHRAFCRAMPIHVHGGISKDEKQALGGEDGAKGGLEGREGLYKMSRRADRVFIASGWVTEFLSRRYKCGEMDISAPIVSRLFQVLSDGNLHYMQARKVADTPFPFPYAQMVAIALILFSMTTPLVMVAFLHQQWLVCLITFASTLTYFSLNEVNRELEEPFKHDPNELPLPHLHYEFNERLEHLLEGVRLVDLDPIGSIEGPQEPGGGTQDDAQSQPEPVSTITPEAAEKILLDQAAQAEAAAVEDKEPGQEEAGTPEKLLSLMKDTSAPNPPSGDVHMEQPVESATNEPVAEEGDEGHLDGLSEEEAKEIAARAARKVQSPEDTRTPSPIRITRRASSLLVKGAHATIPSVTGAGSNGKSDDDSGVMEGRTKSLDEPELGPSHAHQGFRKHPVLPRTHTLYNS